jgi:hypothetical protein
MLFFFIRQDKVNDSSGRSKRFIRTKHQFRQDKIVTIVTKKDPEHWNTRGLITKLRKLRGSSSLF